MQDQPGASSGGSERRPTCDELGAESERLRERLGQVGPPSAELERLLRRSAAPPSASRPLGRAPSVGTSGPPGDRVAGHDGPHRSWQGRPVNETGTQVAPSPPTELSAAERRAFWSDYQPGFRAATAPVGTREFFEEVSAKRYALEPHISEIIAFDRWRGRAILEAGCGIGTDGARFAAAGADYTGLDFSPAAFALAKRRFELEQLPGRFVAGSATALPFEDNTFDLVFSHGVIHHLPDTDVAVREFHRVLKPGGTVVAMVYHRHSLNYHVSIMLVRRAAIGILLLPKALPVAAHLTGEREETLAGHRRLLSTLGFRYLRDRDLFLSHNTDGPGNPLSKVYSTAEAERLFAPFVNVTTEVRYLNLRLYPGGSAFSRTRAAQALERRVGWHLYVRGTKGQAG